MRHIYINTYTRAGTFQYRMWERSKSKHPIWPTWFTRSSDFSSLSKLCCTGAEAFQWLPQIRSQLSLVTSFAQGSAWIEPVGQLEAKGEGTKTSWEGKGRRRKLWLRAMCEELGDTKWRVGLMMLMMLTATTSRRCPQAGFSHGKTAYKCLWKSETGGRG